MNPARRTVLVALAALVVLVGGCSSKSTPQGARSTAPSVSGTKRASTTPSATARRSSDAPATTSKKAGAKKRTSRASSGETADDSWLAITVRAIPTCASAGDKVRIEVRTDPDAYLSISVFYADHFTRAAHGAGYADAEGKFVHAFQLAPGPLGDTSVSAIGTLETTKRGASGVANTSFTVAPPGGCG